jgi:molecular chaperone DnaJ
MQAKDYYRTLGVPEDASADAIKKAYRKIAKANHPDQHPGDRVAEDTFKEASEAYSVLSDTEKRRKYDALRKYGFGEAGPGFQEQGFPGQGFPGGVRFKAGPGGSRTIHFESGQFADMDFADLFGEQSPFADVFEQMFRQSGQGSQGRAGPRRPSRQRTGRVKTAEPTDSFFRRDGLDVHCTVWLKIEQLERGAKVKVRTPAGRKALVSIPSGTRIGSVFRLPGLGLTENGHRGDQFVHVEAVA